MNNQTDDSVETSQSPVSKSIDSQLEEEQTQGQRKQQRAPSPNDADRGLSEQSRTRIGGIEQTSSQQSSMDAMVSGVSGQVQGARTPTVGSSEAKDIDIPNDSNPSSATATRAVSSSSGSVVHDNNTVNTQTGTNQQSEEHIGQINVQTTQQASQKANMTQVTQQRATASTMKRRSSSYEIPNNASIQKLKSKN